MMAKTTPSLYRLNLIREMREKEIKTERKRRLSVIVSLGCFGFFVLSLVYSAMTIWQMERVLKHEEEKVLRLELEYRKYTDSKLIVDKSDLELLANLQGKGIFWTKKLAAMAKYLPDNYTITDFSYNNNEMKVVGYGSPTGRQDQLLILDEYLNRLRADTTFSDTFKKIKLNLADRISVSGRVGFEFSAFTATRKAP